MYLKQLAEPHRERTTFGGFSLQYSDCTYLMEYTLKSRKSNKIIGNWPQEPKLDRACADLSWNKLSI